MSPQFRTRVAILLSVLLLFFGVALFSPLHRHTSGYCSFNNLEHQMVSLAEAAVVLAPMTIPVEAGDPAPIESPFTRGFLAVRDRAPPSFS